MVASLPVMPESPAGLRRAARPNKPPACHHDRAVSGSDQRGPAVAPVSGTVTSELTATVTAAGPNQFAFAVTSQ